MKIQIHDWSSHQAANPSDHRTAAVRPNATKTFEHRYERRKIREQLRRLDWDLNADDEVFA